METHNRKKLMSAVYRYAYSCLVMNYYMFYESMSEHTKTAAFIMEREGELAPVLDGFLAGQGSVEELEVLRGRNREKMEVLTSYGDCFSIYEYVLNRMERRFEKQEPPKQTVEEFVDHVMERMRTAEDSVILDSRIRSVVAQLPVRFTRQKFYGMVLDKLGVYAGTNKKGLEGLFYMLRTAAMIQLPDRMEEEPELCETLDGLKKADFRRMDGEGYKACRSHFQTGIRLLEEKRDACVLFETIIDNLYALLLSRGEALIDVTEEEVFRKILSGVRQMFAEGSGRSMDEAVTEALTDLEGIQESALERIHFSENESDSDLRKLEKLLSASPFAELEEDDGETETADSRWLEAKGNEFCRQLEEAFAGMSKPVTRAVMASVLAQLPVVFASTDQLREYVEGSLLSCTDFAEREAAMELIEQELTE